MQPVLPIARLQQLEAGTACTGMVLRFLVAAGLCLHQNRLGAYLGDAQAGESLLVTRPEAALCNAVLTEPYALLAAV